MAGVLSVKRGRCTAQVMPEALLILIILNMLRCSKFDQPQNVNTKTLTIFQKRYEFLIFIILKTETRQY